jgi:hypothetical protein
MCPGGVPVEDELREILLREVERIESLPSPPSRHDISKHVAEVIRQDPLGPWVYNLPEELARKIPLMAVEIFGDRYFELSRATFKLRHPLLFWAIYAPHVPEWYRSTLRNELSQHGHQEPFARTVYEAALCIAEALRRAGYTFRIRHDGRWVFCYPPVQPAAAIPH